MSRKTVCDQEFWVQVANDYPESQKAMASYFLCDQSPTFRAAWDDTRARLEIRRLARMYNAEVSVIDNHLFRSQGILSADHKIRRLFIDHMVLGFSTVGAEEQSKTWERFKTWVKNL